MTLSFSSLAGGTSFTIITSTGGSKTATLSKTFPAGTYLIESMGDDTNLEIYLGASDGTQVGSCVAGAKSVTASASFLYVTTVNADTNDAVTFTLKSAATLATKTDAVWAPPTITDITPSGLPNIDDTTTITGTNFASNVEVKFRKSDDSTLVTPKTTVRGSATSIIAGRPDSFAPGDAPYDVIVTNPTTTLSASSLNAITAGAVPVWSTSATLPAFQKTVAYSQAVVATDADASPTVTYSQVSATLPTGITFNTSTATFSGTPSANGGSYNAVIRATDLGGNYADRTFTLTQDKPDAPGIGVATATGASTATIAFTAPTYTGTSTITSYTATSSPGGVTATLSQAGSGTITVTGLTAETAYTFTVTATNSSGASVASSASSSITTQSDSLTVNYLVVVLVDCVQL
jgi:Putative Ig domain/Fibronectin type III domain